MKKEILINIYLIIISFIFILVSFLLFLSGGKNQYFLKQKLRIGALIIAITATMGCGIINKQSTANYKTGNENVIIYFHKEFLPNGINVLDYGDPDPFIKGRIKNCNAKNYSYIIDNEKNNEDIFGEIIPIDGKFDSEDEPFKIKFPRYLNPGKYKLKIYDISIDDLKDEFKKNPIAESKFVMIKDGKKYSDKITSKPLRTTCYSRPLPFKHKVTLFNIEKQGNIGIEIKKDNKISGKIEYENIKEISFRIISSDYNIIQKDDIFPIDKEWDSQTEYFVIEIDRNIEPGLYKIQFYNCQVKDQEDYVNKFFYERIIEIKE
ncbi:MAG: hypothetical protein PHV06_03995 [bacterium]|nr:hypothetical protein [bacterium]